MPQELLIQPNGMYAVYSTVADDIKCYDMTEDDVMEYYYPNELRKLREYKEEGKFDGITTMDAVLSLYKDELFEKAKTNSFDDNINHTAWVHGPDRANGTLRIMGLPERDFSEYIKKCQEETEVVIG